MAMTISERNNAIDELYIVATQNAITCDIETIKKTGRKKLFIPGRDTDISMINVEQLTVTKDKYGIYIQ